MRPALLASLTLAIAMPAAEAAEAGDPVRERAFQDHIAYVATFAMPVLIEKCTALDADYLQRAAPSYFRYVNTHQDQIERGRLLTLAELAPGETLAAYRASTLAARLGRLDTGTPEQKRKTCDGALDMLSTVLSGAKIPGEWPARE